MLRSHVTWLGAAIAISVAQAAVAADYSAIYVFGDSLSDRGNLADVVAS